MGRVNITMPDELWAAVGEAAEEAYGGNRSLFVRKALKAHLMNAGLRQAAARTLAAPTADAGEGRPTAHQLAGRNKVPVATAARWLDSDEWQRYWS